MVLGLGACGFRPLYGRRAGGDAVLADLAAIDVATIDAPPLDVHVAQILRRELRRELDPRDAGAARRYRLEVALSRRVEPLAISSDDIVTRYNVQLTSAIRLVDLADGAVAYATTVRTVGSYDVQKSDFGTVIAEESASADGARDLSARIVSLLATFLLQRAAGP